MAFKMNKKRNSGLVYEFLVRQLAKQLLEKDSDMADMTVSIVESYFSDGCPIAEELELFRVIRETRGVSADVARQILKEVGNRARGLDYRKIDFKKSSLIRELNRIFGRDFFDRHRLSEYRLLGAIQLYIDGRRGKRLSESVQAIQLEEGLVRWMTTRPPVAEEPVEGVDDLVCAMAAKRFNEKYGSSLGRDQRVLLETYVRSLVTEDVAPLVKRLEEDRNRVARLLVTAYGTREVQEDRVMKGRFVEAARRLSTIDLSKGDDGALEEMMLFHKLAEEIQSNE